MRRKVVCASGAAREVEDLLLVVWLVQQSCGHQSCAGSGCVQLKEVQLLTVKDLDADLVCGLSGGKP